MEIICRKCGFGREIPDDKVPPNAEIATCPKCKNKFRFRYLEKEGDTDSPTTAGPEPPKPDEDIWQRLETMDIPDDDEAPHASAFSGQKAESEADSTSQTTDAEPGDTAVSADKVVLDWEMDSEEEITVDVPWERLDKYGFFPGLTKTIKAVMFQAPLFFRHITTEGKAKPLIFNILIGEFSILAHYLWILMGVRTFWFGGTQSLDAATALDSGMLLTSMVSSLIFYPIFLIPALFISAGLTHLFLVLVKSGSAGYEATFRVSAYASAPQVLAAVPYVGIIIGSLWAVAATFIGLKNIHRTSYLRVFLAFMLAIAILTSLVFIFGAPLSTGGYS